MGPKDGVLSAGVEMLTKHDHIRLQLKVAVTLVQHVEVDQVGQDRVRGVGQVHVSHVLRRMHRRTADPAATE